MRYLIQSIFVLLIATAVLSVVVRLLTWISTRRGAATRASASRVEAQIQALRHLVCWAALLLVHFVFIAALSDATEIDLWLADVGSAAATASLVTAVLSLLACARIELAMARPGANDPRS